MGLKLALVAGLTMIFVVSVAVLMRIMPGPHRPTDYLVIGTLATFTCLVVLFVINVTVGSDARDVFFKRRK